MCTSQLAIASYSLLCIILDDLTFLLKEIMQEARSLTSAEKCSVFLMERDASELVAKVFDGDIADDQVTMHNWSDVQMVYL